MCIKLLIEDMVILVKWWASENKGARDSFLQVSTVSKGARTHNIVFVMLSIEIIFSYEKVVKEIVIKGAWYPR